MTTTNGKKQADSNKRGALDVAALESWLWGGSMCHPRAVLKARMGRS